jgi:hypothetical protein
MANFGIADHNAGFEAGLRVVNVLRDDLQIHMALFEHERFDRELFVSEQALCSLGDLGIFVGNLLG